MKTVNQAELNRLVQDRQPPCVSVYVPFHRGMVRENEVRWRTAFAEATQQLVAGGMSRDDANDLLAPVRKPTDNTFWSQPIDGAAAFVARDFSFMTSAPMGIPEKVIVADRFHLIPLLLMLNGDDVFYVLAISQNHVRLFQGTRESLVEVELTNVPENLEAALATHDRDNVLNYHTRPNSAGRFEAIFHGHGVGIDDKKSDITLYFQIVDRALQPYLRGKSAPLVLAAVEFLRPIFRNTTSYAFCLDDGIDGNPERIDQREMHRRAWEIVKPTFDRAREQAIESWYDLSATKYASAEPSAVCAGTVEGRVDTLFVSVDRPIWGSFDAGSGHVECHSEPQTGDRDLRDLAIAKALKHGRKVYALPGERMPQRSKLAAIFVHPMHKH